MSRWFSGADYLLGDAVADSYTPFLKLQNSMLAQGIPLASEQDVAACAQKLIDEHGWEGAVMVAEKLVDQADYAVGYMNITGNEKQRLVVRSMYLRRLLHCIEGAE